MRDCENPTMQEALPAYRAGGLEAQDAEVVRAHLATCEACTLEWELLATARAVIGQATPVVDLDRIAAAVTAATPGAVRPPVTAPRGIALRTRRWWGSRQLLAAAASILVVVSLSIPALRGTGTGPVIERRPDSVVAGDSPGGQSAGAPLSSIDLAGGLADLSSAQLEAFLKELDQVEATVRAEPAAVALPLLDAPESL